MKNDLDTYTRWRNNNNNNNKKKNTAKYNFKHIIPAKRELPILKKYASSNKFCYMNVRLRV
jgi:hypothetical protein